MKKIINFGLLVAEMALLILGVLLIADAIESVVNPPTFDTSILSKWCGQSTGTIRMIGACACDVDILEDETGKLWYCDEIKKNMFYLLWIDDMGTNSEKDDTIVKIWQEK